MPAIFVGGLATCGWLLTNFNARRNQAEKNAYDLILLYQKEKYYVDHRAEIHKRFAPYVEIDAANAKLLVSEYYDQGSYSPPAAEISLPGKGQRSAAYSLVQIINFYEYLAIGIKRGILSDNLCRAYFRTTLSNFNRKKARRFVDEVINRELSERKDISRSSIFSNYLWLLNHWRC